MNLAPVGNERRTQREFPTPDQCLRNSDGKEEIGFPDIVVIEVIHHVGLEVVGIERPSTKGDGNSKLMLFIPLAVQRYESQIVGVDEFQQRARGRNQRRSLIIVPVESAEDPMQMRNYSRQLQNAG